MLKRSISLLALLFCMVPMLAFAGTIPTAGTITSRVMTQHGSVEVNNALLPATYTAANPPVLIAAAHAQRAADGSVTKSYPVNTSIPYTIIPDAGYVVSQIIVDGGAIQLNPPLTGSLTIPVVTNLSGTSVATPQSLLIYFSQDTSTTTSVVGTASGSGVVIPAGIQNLTTGASASYIFAPDSGGSVNSIIGLPNGAVLTDANLGTPAVLPYRGAVKVAFIVPAPANPVGMVATFSVPLTLSAGASKTVGIGTTTLTASLPNAPAGTSYVWTQTNGTPLGTILIPWTASGITVPAGPLSVGTYGFAVTAYDVNGKALTYPAFTTVTAVTALAPPLTPAQVGQTQCEDCHSAAGVGAGIFAKWSVSIHGQSTYSLCSDCHVGTATGAHPGTVNYDSVNNATFQTLVPGVNGFTQGTIFCTTCHSSIPHTTTDLGANTCVQCHTNPNLSGQGGTGDAHNIQGLSCVGCHAVGQSNPFNDKALVNDNSGVRAVVGEFSKWSHHIVNPNGAAPLDEQCAVCHLEGTVVNYGSGDELSVNGAKHMTDAFIHLRNVQNDSAEFTWDPANPNHTNMDNFCMTCHSAAGATSAMSVKLQNLITPLTGITASATNPFGDTISNKYDKMMRPAVTNVNDQFNTTNNSHHGVKGARYTGRTRVAGPRQIANPSAFANNSSALMQGIRSTIYDAGNFNANYTPLGNAGGEVGRTGAASLGDDSTLHCGDCHTVGQWKPGSATNIAGFNTYSTAAGRNVTLQPAIGAHGSNNEYMLRNTLGTDVRHTQNAYTLDANNVVTMTNPNGAFLVCYNCHAYKKYGSIYLITGQDNGLADGSPLQPHAGEYDVQGRCSGIGNTLPFGGYTTGKATDGTQFAPGNNPRIYGVPGKNSAAAPYAGEQSTDFGNIFGIQCLNCHNSGIGNAYGGIHGSANNTNRTDITADPSVAGGAYIAGNGWTTKVERFLPGLGNAMFAPGTLGGSSSGTTTPISNDTNWEQKHGSQTVGTVINYANGTVSPTLSAGAGCYTLDTATATGAATDKLQNGPSVTGPIGQTTPAIGTWGGCNDHKGAQGSGTAFLKVIVRPITY